MTLQPLLERAFETVRAADANVEIDRVRTSRADGLNEVLSYEVLADERAGLEGLAQKVLPKLVYFLDCRGLKLPEVAGVFVSLFAGDRLYFLHVKDFFEVVAPVTGLDVPALVKKYGAEAAHG